MVTHVRRGLSSPATEIVKGHLGHGLFGSPGEELVVHRPDPDVACREAAKIWALSDLPRRRGRAGHDKTRHYLSSLVLLSQSLHHRPDHGDDPTCWVGSTSTCSSTGWPTWNPRATISTLTRLLACREVRKVLTALRQLGATGGSGPAAGLSDQFALHRDDMPAEPDRPEPGRATFPLGSCANCATTLTR